MLQLWKHTNQLQLPIFNLYRRSFGEVQKASFLAENHPRQLYLFIVDFSDFLGKKFI